MPKYVLSMAEQKVRRVQNEVGIQKFCARIQNEKKILVACNQMKKLKKLEGRFYFFISCSSPVGEIHNFCSNDSLAGNYIRT